jgi:hypothetical protein
MVLCALLITSCAMRCISEVGLDPTREAQNVASSFVAMVLTTLRDNLIDPY